MKRRFAAFLAAIAATSPAHAELRPEWEFGLGATGLTLPDYRGSDESRGYLLPFPYIIYRGERFRVDRQGLRGIFFESDRIEFNLSVNATPPVDEDNRARQGMPELDPTIEIGPRLDITLARDREREWSFEARFPVRAAIATDLSHTQHVGWVAYPHLHLFTRPNLGGVKWNLGLQGGPCSRHASTTNISMASIRSSQRRSAPRTRRAAATRARSRSSRSAGAFRACGWAPSRATTSSKARCSTDSPLVRRDYAFMAGIAVAWVFAESAKKVEVDVDE